MKESGVVERLTKMAQNELMNIITLFLGVTVGATATASSFLSAQTIGIIVLGLIAFCFSTVGGLFLGDIMCWVTKGALIRLSEVPAFQPVPMAARVSQTVGQKENPQTSFDARCNLTLPELSSCCCGRCIPCNVRKSLIKQIIKE